MSDRNCSVDQMEWSEIGRRPQISPVYWLVPLLLFDGWLALECVRLIEHLSVLSIFGF